MGTSPQLGVDGELCFRWQDPTGPHLTADLRHLLPSDPLRLAHLEIGVAEAATLNRRTSCRGSGVGASVCASRPTPEIPALRENCPSEGLPAVHSSSGSAFLPGPRYPQWREVLMGQQKASVRAQGSLQAYCRIWPPSLVQGRGSLRCGERHIGRNREKMPKKTTYSENVLTDVGGNFSLSPHVPTITVFQFIWSYINFGGAILGHSYHVLTMYGIHYVSSSWEPTDLNF